MGRKMLKSVNYRKKNGTLYCNVFAFCLYLQRKQSLNRKDMNIENAKSQMRKGMLEYCILLLLERQPAYSSDIIRSLKEAELLVVEGTLYPLLNRLKREGLLQYRWEESRMGPPRKYYALTDVGLQMLRDLDKAWAEISNTVNYLKNHQPTTLQS